MLTRRTLSLSLVISLALLHSFPPTTVAQNSDEDMLARIRKEGMEHSQILKTMHMLTDVYGPRLTGSPNHKRAAEWAIEQMTDWGFENGHLEPWNFGHPGWLNERLSAHIISPIKDSLVCEVLAWTPSTRGPVKGKVVQIVLPERPTQEQFNAFMAKEKSRVRGRIVLAGKPQVVPVNLTPPPKRADDKQIQQRFDPDARPSPSPSPSPTPPGPKPLTANQIAEQTDKFLKDNFALLRVNDAGREHGQIRAFNNRTFDVNKAVPTVVMRNEDYGRISRILADNTEVVLEFDILNRVYPEGKTSYNTIAEIPGSDKADEVIMLGGHLDSWHAATGATDNAIGCAIMMEAARILKSIGVKPRRTIRVGLWSGEEQGLLGSLAYVKEHFGSYENPKPGYEKFGGYFNIDSGTGRIRGASVFGPPETGKIMRDLLKPFKDEGVAGAIATRSRGVGGTDSTSFNNAGLPGIGLSQDMIEYGTHTWHTSLDTYERILEDDVKKDAVIVAFALYKLAMRDELLPRFSRETMPPPPPVEPTPTPTPTPTAKPRALLKKSAP
ncbi:MAG TPA: M20/M25/M40 family metallo-hydrolase [Pyrinomonadaceae bacterium]|nr:M20/M25/M40 family metallo-hydrolase [Pyrinomonadaceae bacterium]